MTSREGPQRTHMRGAGGAIWTGAMIRSATPNQERNYRRHNSKGMDFHTLPPYILPFFWSGACQRHTAVHQQTRYKHLGRQQPCKAGRDTRHDGGCSGIGATGFPDMPAQGRRKALGQCQSRLQWSKNRNNVSSYISPYVAILVISGQLYFVCPREERKRLPPSEIE